MRLSLLAPLDRLKAPAPDPARVAWLSQWRYAHRGLHGPGFPENSPSAFGLALEAGAGIECDIQRSADGKAMVFHDWDLDRLTGEKGPLASLRSQDLQRLTLTGSKDGIPTLEELLAQIDGKVPLLIEIKSKPKYRVAPTCLAVRRALEGYRGLHAVMSFDPRVSRWFATHSPQTVRGLVVTEEDDRALPGRWRRHRYLWHAKPDFLAYDIRDLPSSFAASQRKRGLPVLTWTVRSAELAERAAEHADAPIAEGAGLA
ncbi:MAG: glycerophosphodiester phosphodiesterase [Sphingomonadaceae bacterium]|nr:glycerophosphodiester phosphodiesterase [Sphingomonadaceae bacterium]